MEHRGLERTQGYFFEIFEAILGVGVDVHNIVPFVIASLRTCVMWAAGYMGPLVLRDRFRDKDPQGRSLGCHFAKIREQRYYNRLAAAQASTWNEQAKKRNETHNSQFVASNRQRAPCGAAATLCRPRPRWV
jgi:hypothetical protein